jgi:pyridoxine 5'-phosphate synthase PdxJ
MVNADTVIDSCWIDVCDSLAAYQNLASGPRHGCDRRIEHPRDDRRAFRRSDVGAVLKPLNTRLDSPAMLFYCNTAARRY